MSAAAFGYQLTLEQWQIIFHETMATVLRAKEAVKRGIGFWGVVNGLWRASRDIKTLTAQMKAISELPDGILTEEFIAGQIPQLQKLLASVEELVSTAKAHRLMNRTLTASPLHVIAAAGDGIFDYLDSLKMSIDPDIIHEIQAGKDQIQRGEFEEMERLF
jgi:hypothetical protein